jgi:hypothetical protein
MEQGPFKTKCEVSISPGAASTLTLTFWLGNWPHVRRVLWEMYPEESRELVDGVEQAIRVEEERYRKERFGGQQ